MTSDNCVSAFEDDGDKLDIPMRKRSHSRYSSRHKHQHRNQAVDIRMRVQDGYSTTSGIGLKNTESELDEDDMAHSSTHGFYQGND